MLTDLSANHPTLGYRQTNTKGRQLHNLIQNRTLQHIGPHFPTFISRKSATSPDIILSNFRTYHNTYISQGPLITNDHIPIMFTIATKPIQIPTTPSSSYIQADWQKFQEELAHTCATTETPPNPTLEEIDHEIDNWHAKVSIAIRNHIPKTHYKALPHTPFSPLTQTLISQFIALKQHASLHGSNLHTYRNTNIYITLYKRHLWKTVISTGVD